MTTPQQEQKPPDTTAPQSIAAFTDFSWMQRSRQWGTRAPLGPGGLTIDGINIGVYGEIPDVWGTPSRMPRGAYPVSGAVPLRPVFINHKWQQWAEHAGELYEESISRRWACSAGVWEKLLGTVACSV